MNASLALGTLANSKTWSWRGVAAEGVRELEAVDRQPVVVYSLPTMRYCEAFLRQ